MLHTGVASLESTELSYPERVRVPATTATRVNESRRHGGRVIAVGTTVVRALETAGREDGVVHPFDGWTDLVVTPERGERVVDGLLTGWHEPEASHLLMLAVAGRTLLESSHTASLQEATSGTSSATCTSYFRDVRSWSSIDHTTRGGHHGGEGNGASTIGVRVSWPTASLRQPDFGDSTLHRSFKMAVP